jgi:hypothetical protein
MVDNAARMWEKKCVYLLLLGHLRSLGDFGVDGRREEVFKKLDMRCRLDSRGCGYGGISGGLL